MLWLELALLWIQLLSASVLGSPWRRARGPGCFLLEKPSCEKRPCWTPRTSCLASAFVHIRCGAFWQVLLTTRRNGSQRFPPVPTSTCWNLKPSWLRSRRFLRLSQDVGAWVASTHKCVWGRWQREDPVPLPSTTLCSGDFAILLARGFTTTTCTTWAKRTELMGPHGVVPLIRLALIRQVGCWT